MRVRRLAGQPQRRAAARLVLAHERATAHLVVVNLAAQDAQARVRLPWSDLAGRTWQLHDALNGDAFERDGGELQDSGLYVGMGPWEPDFLALAA